MATTHEKLAVLGGAPVRQRPWPTWPRADENTERNLLEVLYSGRWAVSGMYNGTPLYERHFAEAFAAYNGVPYCVPVTNGAAALTIALQALGVGYGKEVLVPGVTWVACASAVIRAGGIPVLVDVEPDTLCLSAEAAQEAITERTAAIMLVHLYCTIGDIDAFLQLSNETGVPLLEDCSQAHGAVWSGQRVGSYGKIGVFSMQDTKLLTSGEGGAAITSDTELYNILQQMRADGRRYKASSPPLHHIELEEIGEVQGWNYNLSEFQAAVLLDRLQHLDAENELRTQNAAYLTELLADVGAIVPLARHPKADTIAYYQFCARLDPSEFGNLDIETLCRALTAEIGVVVEPIHRPLNNNILYNPLLSPQAQPEVLERLNPKQFSLPNSTHALGCYFRIPHRVLLAARHDMEDIAAAFLKVKENHRQLIQAM